MSCPINCFGSTQLWHIFKYLLLMSCFFFTFGPGWVGYGEFFWIHSSCWKSRWQTLLKEPFNMPIASIPGLGGSTHCHPCPQDLPSGLLHYWITSLQDYCNMIFMRLPMKTFESFSWKECRGTGIKWRLVLNTCNTIASWAALVVSVFPSAIQDTGCLLVAWDQLT